MSAYDRIIIVLVKWISVCYIIVCGILFIFVLSDVLLGVDWGYPWWSALAVSAMLAIGLVVRQLQGVR